jgi:hypothetical protein
VIEIAPDLIDLEYGNKKTHLKEAKRKMRELKTLVNEFDKRLRTEVTEEVMDHAAKNKHKYPGNPEYLNKKSN